MTGHKIETEDEAALRAERPVRVRLPGLIQGDEVGLGDAIKRVTYVLGVRPCGGCQQRARALNRWMVFTR
jgi:hypothetical protein